MFVDVDEDVRCATEKILLNCLGSIARLACGEVSERFKEHAWKACVGEILPWVRIPPSPPFSSEKQQIEQTSLT